MSIFVELDIKYIKNPKKFCCSLPEAVRLCQANLEVVPSHRMAQDKSLTGPDCQLDIQIVPAN